MTDRINSITLTLDKDIRIDDAESLLTACRAFRGVIDVTPNVASIESHISQERARAELGTGLFKLIYGDRYGDGK